MGRVVGAFSVDGEGEGLETGLARLDQVHARAIAVTAIHACRCRSMASRIRTDRRVLRCRPATPRKFAGGYRSGEQEALTNLATHLAQGIELGRPSTDWLAKAKVRFAISSRSPKH